MNMPASLCIFIFISKSYLSEMLRDTALLNGIITIVKIR